MTKKVLYETKETIYKLYEGDTTVAVVVSMLCTHSFIVGQTGATYQRNGDIDPWKGASATTLKNAGFRYVFANNVYRDINGNTYHRIAGEEGWFSDNPEGEDYEDDEVRVVE